MRMKVRSTMTTNETTNQLGYAGIVAWIQSIIDALFAKATDDNAESVERLEFATARATKLFIQALHENSNLELDWRCRAALLPQSRARDQPPKQPGPQRAGEAAKAGPGSRRSRGAISRGQLQRAGVGDSEESDFPPVVGRHPQP